MEPLQRILRKQFLLNGKQSLELGVRHGTSGNIRDMPAKLSTEETLRRELLAYAYGLEKRASEIKKVAAQLKNGTKRSS
jgi:hypothetical protein